MENRMGTYDTENIIEIKNLSKTFKVTKREEGSFLKVLKTLYKRDFVTVEAVRNVSFSVKKGEIRGLIGANGAGKSTLIKMMCGILYPSEGDVITLGLKPWEQRNQYVCRIGVVFGQKSQLNWDLPAIDTFQLNKKMYKIPEDVFQENIEYFSGLLDIRAVIARPVRQLSLGERMKCELMCSLLHNPELVFLDEPTIGLDVVSKDTMLRIIRKINEERRTTFILTTHDMGDIENLCRHITIINKGEKVYDGSLYDLRKNYKLQKVIEIYAKEIIDPDLLKDYQIEKLSQYEATIRVDGDADMGKILEQLSGRLDIKDITIGNVGIEEVIKKIYTE